MNALSSAGGKATATILHAGSANERTIDESRAAWERIRDHGRKSWDDWLQVARALALGRTEALKAPGSDRAVGSRHNAAMGAWLLENSAIISTPKATFAWTRG